MTVTDASLIALVLLGGFVAGLELGNLAHPRIDHVGACAYGEVG